jgi:acetyltransferase-like isoleucine patch superfamily enzyme
VARIAIKDISASARVNRLAGIFGGENIQVKPGVMIWDYTWIAALSPVKTDVKLIIGEGTTIGRFNHIYATKRVEIGKNVLTADKVYISDSLHEYTNITIPIKKQPIKQLNEVYIGDGCWIGENVCIIGATIGKNCVIGANSVVLKDVPDYAVAVGIPAKIIKQYNFETDAWEKCSEV